MRIHIGTDHAGFELKGELLRHFTEAGHEVVDHGCYVYDRMDDYPEFCIAAAEATLADPGSLGIVLGGSGNGEQMAANCVPGIRAALVWNVATAKLAREHNNAQIAALGARQHSIQEAIEILDAFINEPFSEDERHIGRINQMLDYERAHKVK